MSYLAIRHLHITCAVLSIGLFALRGAMQLAGVDWRKWRSLRILPHLNDTILLGAAVAMVIISQQYPLAQLWLMAKILGLCVYVVLGSQALKQNLSAKMRAWAFAGALLSVSYIAGVAITRSAGLGLF